jgi:hypothetical protein
MVEFPAFAAQVSRLYRDPRWRTVEDVLESLPGAVDHEKAAPRSKPREE